MSRLREFRRKLDEIQRRREPGRSPERERRWSPFLQSVLTRASQLPPPPPHLPRDLAEVCSGEVREAPRGGRAWVMVECDPAWSVTAARLSAAVSSTGSPLRERLHRFAGAAEPRAEDLLFVDIETTGLGSTPLFLIGTMSLVEGGLRIRQYLARDYAEERAALEMFLEELGDGRILVSFNGKSFDLPYIRVRLSYHRESAPPALPHYDVLLEARRVWRGTVPDCRLKTLEHAICGRERVDDIDGALIPEAYHRFVRTGDAAEIALVVRHNRHDLLTMAELMLRMPALPA